MVWFFAGGETRDDRFNIFTGSFINLMKKIMEDDFDFIRGVYNKSTIMNVIRALNNAQRPFADPENKKITSAAFNQIISCGLSPETQIVITSSRQFSGCWRKTDIFTGEDLKPSRKPLTTLI